MTQVLIRTLTGFVTFIVLDGLWLGVMMKAFYRTALAPIARMTDGGLAPIWSVAWVIYVLLGAGVAVFVVPRATNTASAALLGAVLGVVVYGVYDLTNYSTLAQWPLAVTVVDIAWGTVATALASAIVFILVGR